MHFLRWQTKSMWDYEHQTLPSPAIHGSWDAADRMSVAGGAKFEGG
jgi:hypothetical protein